MPQFIGAIILAVFVLNFFQVIGGLLFAGLDLMLGTWPLHPPALSWAIHGFVIGVLVSLATTPTDLVPNPALRVGSGLLLLAWALLTFVGAVNLFGTP
jgi:hypothetical protein